MVCKHLLHRELWVVQEEHEKQQHTRTALVPARLVHWGRCVVRAPSPRRVGFAVQEYDHFLECSLHKLVFCQLSRRKLQRIDRNNAALGYVRNHKHPVRADTDRPDHACHAAQV